METPEIVKHTWTQLVIRLTARFNSEGYQVVQEHHQDPLYGSSFIIWSNNQDALCLTWDGNERWFTLEEAALPISATTLWQPITLVEFDPENEDTESAKSTIDKVLKSLD